MLSLVAFGLKSLLLFELFVALVDKSIQQNIRHMPVTHPLIAWLVEHAAFARLTGVVGQDGKTAYYRIRATEHSLRLPFFGERLRYNGRSKEGGVAGEGTRWSEGVFVGVHRRTNQYLMFGAECGIWEARAVMRFPDELKFDADIAQAVNIAPQHVHDPKVHKGSWEQVIPRRRFRGRWCSQVQATLYSTGKQQPLWTHARLCKV